MNERINNEIIRKEALKHAEHATGASSLEAMLAVISARVCCEAAARKLKEGKDADVGFSTSAVQRP